MIVPLLLLALVQRPAPSPGDTTAGRPCVVDIDSVGGRAQQVEVRKGETNVFAGGGVLAHCRGTGSTLSADSVAWFAGIGRFDMIGQRHLVHIRDTTLTLDAVNASYFLHQERLEAHKNVVAVNRITGSVLRGPNLTYYRALKGVRDTLEMYASGRPTIDYRSNADSGEPYIIVGDRVRFKGNDRMWGGGKVTIDRSDFAARGDSMQLDQGAGFAVLVGRPRVEGKGARAYALTGTRIELGLRDREIRLVKALGQGVATGTDWRLTADTIHLALDRRKLQHAFAWSGGGGGGKGDKGDKGDKADKGGGADRGGRDSTRAKAVSTLNTIEADSLALDTPDEVLTEARAFRHALSTSKKDASAAAAVDWIAGDSLTAHWTQLADTGGKTKSELHQIVARGAARSLSHIYSSAKDSAAALGPAIDYSRGQMIDIALKAGKVDRIVVSGRADGVHLEPAPPKPPPADSAAKKPSNR
ncbi:MAG: hypothetical protein AUH45_04215 [Gemmatimonadetes bacterium 13_1_40CM_69_22]|nr:MAG: hypothetical protein AUH45_04215 [Gemmatimonadetes bacterium 13_1_40CM_69_22]